MGANLPANVSRKALAAHQTRSFDPQRLLLPLQQQRQGGSLRLEVPGKPSTLLLMLLMCLEWQALTIPWGAAPR